MTGWGGVTDKAFLMHIGATDLAGTDRAGRFVLATMMYACASKRSEFETSGT